ncbi:DUF3301 domain-containing protein [Ferrimonas sediminicola]|uniref:DUF3301 domain-containing protein n=1 Tax=Ferrimonas sediminicola TaxID=2569538 RepID=A0A4U1BG90_9GAMM|nr:DUF3301 domain-containing protein [Ferrimonas sediminicola]TKB49732.1 DUF3301 domain-containing protein [Ferrimonas sediminicola]
MLNLTDLILGLVVCGIAAIFWQLRQISEIAEFHAKRVCQKRRLQWISTARVQARLGFIAGQGLGWNTRYQCEFSTDGMNRLYAVLVMNGRKLKDVEMPLYPEPEWQEAPESKGRIGGCGGGGAPTSNCSSGGCSSGCK